MKENLISWPNPWSYYAVLKTMNVSLYKDIISNLSLSPHVCDGGKQVRVMISVIVFDEMLISPNKRSLEVTKEPDLVITTGKSGRHSCPMFPKVVTARLKITRGGVPPTRPEIGPYGVLI